MSTSEMTREQASVAAWNAVNAANVAYMAYLSAERALREAEAEVLRAQVAYNKTLDEPPTDGTWCECGWTANMGPCGCMA